jgi:hypothetical protein
MHIMIGLGLALGLFIISLIQRAHAERKRMALLQRHQQMLYPDADPAALRQYVQDVYGRR